MNHFQNHFLFLSVRSTLKISKNFHQPPCCSPGKRSLLDVTGLGMRAASGPFGLSPPAGLGAGKSGARAPGEMELSPINSFHVAPHMTAKQKVSFGAFPAETGKCRSWFCLFSESSTRIPNPFHEKGAQPTARFEFDACSSGMSLLGHSSWILGIGAGFVPGHSWNIPPSRVQTAPFHKAKPPHLPLQASAL